jgi:AraC-like DNA-binding protein
MIYRTYAPGPPLANFVELFWLYEGYHPAHTKERRLPTGTMTLVINLHEDEIRVYDRQNPAQSQRFPGCVLSGVHSEYAVIDTASQASTIGVHFKPGGAFPFLGRPASELRATDVPLDALWGADAGTLREQLLDAETPTAKFQRLERALLAQADRPLERHPAVAFALRAFERTPRRPIADVVERIGLCHRRFIKVFREEAGLTPKLFCRLQRFQDALHFIECAQRVDLTDAALSCGYYDQAHFNREFHAFSGINPTTYLARRGEHRNHVVIDG